MTPPFTTAETHLRRMADVLNEARQDLAEGVAPMSLLLGLQRLVPCECVGFSELDVPTRTGWNERCTPYDEDQGPMEAYWRWRHQHLQCEQVSRPHDTPETTQMADFVSAYRLRNLPIYTEFLRPCPTIADVALPTAPGRTRVFQLFRTDGQPFKDHEMTTLRLLAPHLYEIYLAAARRRRTPVRLTDRELDVLRCVALGMTTPQIAEQLCVAPSTVRKHLENAFGRLGVSSRTAAVARVFPEYA
ncbi:helix-turn-helix domain-containing protein [Streptomyces pseudovenezuelae]|uniref:DNA-binding CsgD family transcriptional regulator n=1 Tax=Streptomyces pseudovenezuelae TaxID=67350 RepID=A0ABT6LJQ9_9ACTN|nr:helix-turn-helix transcriptional regulator [Streptomyces pseudovenezuelae]MDH6216546.1 DNA-binding CsgD family transcriptional regulator [Streptomyces pseudovenezuelae]